MNIQIEIKIELDDIEKDSLLLQDEILRVKNKIQLFKETQRELEKKLEQNRGAYNKLTIFKQKLESGLSN